MKSNCYKLLRAGGMLLYSKLISSGTGCRSRAEDAFVPTAAVNYLHSVLLHNSVSKQAIYLTIKRQNVTDFCTNEALLNFTFNFRSTCHVPIPYR